MTWWNQVVALQDELADQAQFRTNPEIINIDIQNSAGTAHSGFPIQAYRKHWGNPANWENLPAKGSWGDFHELRPNHQRVQTRQALRETYRVFLRIIEQVPKQP